MSRYSTGARGEAQPGSRGRVLRNRQGVTSVRELGRLESQALELATNLAVDETDVDHRFTAEDICGLHRQWLERIYTWAGEYRTVNLSRDGFLFAVPQQINLLMEELEAGPLRTFTPCHAVGSQAQAVALATVHAELILIHPFREGNGRCARLLATLMGLQAGLPPLNFDRIKGPQRALYIKSIQVAAQRDYAPLSKVFEDVIARTLRSVGGGSITSS